MDRQAHRVPAYMQEIQRSARGAAAVLTACTIMTSDLGVEREVGVEPALIYFSWIEEPISMCYDTILQVDMYRLTRTTWSSHGRGDETAG